MKKNLGNTVVTDILLCTTYLNLFVEVLVLGDLSSSRDLTLSYDIMPVEICSLALHTRDMQITFD